MKLYFLRCSNDMKFYEEIRSWYEIEDTWRQINWKAKFEMNHWAKCIKVMGLTTFPECALLILFVFYDCSYCHDVFNTKSVGVIWGLLLSWLQFLKSCSLYLIQIERFWSTDYSPFGQTNSCTIEKKKLMTNLNW